MRERRGTGFHANLVSGETAMTRTSVVLTLALIAMFFIGGAVAAERTGSAVVQVVTEPDVAAGTFLFSGVPAGELTLPAGQPPGLTATQLAPGSHASILDVIDPAILAAGYALTAIDCDDQDSTEPSTGDVPGKQATFRIEEGEAVTCVFKLTKEPTESSASQPQGCICPRQGRWKVNNHVGEMACTGSFAMTVPLKASRSKGTLEIQNDCETIVAAGPRAAWAAPTKTYPWSSSSPGWSPRANGSPASCTPPSRKTV
jgi:hypothetical protein